jgi:DNA-directed RNA polymerase specialized sigma24 family protein
MRLDISDYQGALPEVSRESLASMPLGRRCVPTQAARRAGRILSVREAPSGLDPIDRKALALRHLEPLSRSEAAQLLGTSHELGRNGASAP